MKDYEMNEEFTSQKAQVRHHLLQGKSITPLEALNKFGIFRLAAVVHELRNEGLDIITEKFQVSPKKRVARYYIKPENLNK